MIRERNLDPALRAQIHGSMPGQAENLFVVKSGEAPEDYFRYKRPSDNVFQTIAAAFSSAVSCRNDTLIITPGSHSLGASLTWNKNNTHMIGSYYGAVDGIRNRIGMGTTFTPMVTVSGHSNTFANLYSMHGTATGDSMGWRITGARNLFHRVNFGGPFNATQAGNVGYEGISVEGTLCSFEQCVIGTDNQARDTSNVSMTLAAGTHTTLRDCDFLALISDANVLFINVENTTTTHARIHGCLFMAVNANWATSMATAIGFTSGSTAGIVIDPGCLLVNVDQWCSAANDQYGVWTPIFADLTDADNILRATRKSFTT